MSLVNVKLWLLIVVTLAAGGINRAQPLSGTAAKDLFLGYVTNLSDHWIDFQAWPMGTAVENQFQDVGVQCVSTKNVDGSVFAAPHNVVVGTFGTNLVIVGTPYRGGGEDGQVGYEVRFTQPQRRAGIHRYWFNGYALTRFHAFDGTLLHEFAGTGFVAYACTGDDTNRWISRIEMDGQRYLEVRQVGYADDLIFGAVAPPDPTPSLQLDLYAGILLSGQKGLPYTVEFVDAAGDTNAWQVLTNLTLPASPHLIFDLGSTNAHQRFYRSRLSP